MTDKERECQRKKFEEEIKPAYDAWIVHYPLTIENLPGEIWLPIPDYDKYQCSNWGRIKSFWGKEPKILKPCPSIGGYLYVSLCKGSKPKKILVHVLVGKLFIPNPENKPQVDHRFGLKFDCSVWNLRWATGSENMEHAVRTGLKKSGSEHPDAKLTKEQALYIRENPDGLNTFQLAEKFNVSAITIQDIQRGKIYKNIGGKIRGKLKGRIPEEIRAKIRAEYVKGSSEFGISALAKKYGINRLTVWKIIHELD